MPRTIAEVAALTEGIFDGTAAYRRSHAARNRLGLKDRSFVYGESLLEPFAQLVALTGPSAGRTFFDLGCGAGRAAIFASLLFDFEKVVGVEFLGELLTSARNATQALRKKGAPLSNVSWKRGDMLEQDLSGAHVIYVVSAVFSQALLDPLCQKLDALDAGTWVIALGQMLEGKRLQRVHRVPVMADWGPTAAHVYRLSSP